MWQTISIVLALLFLCSSLVCLELVRRLIAERVRQETDCREFPCNDCACGEMKLISTSPGFRGSTERYKCNQCGIEETFP